MSIKDLNPEHDEFEAFLRGEDELSSLLQGLPQFAPSAELDATILADAERAIARSQTPLPPAANDAIVPESARIAKPSFASRWKLPLGLAASILVMFPIVQSMRHTHSPHGYIVEMPPEATPFEVNIVADANAPIKLPQERVLAEFPLLAQAAPAAPPPPSIEMARQANAAPLELKKHAAGDTVLADAGPTAKSMNFKSREERADSSKKASSETESDWRKRPPVVVAQADTHAVEQVVTTGIRASLQQSMSQKRNADSHVEVITAEDIGKMPDKNVADSLQRVPSPSENTGSALKQKREADSHIDVIVGSGFESERASNAYAAPRSTGQMAPPAAKPAMVFAPAIVQPTAPDQVSKDQGKAKAWLALVEEKLKAGSNSAALDEWIKFRKVYPNYPVPDAVIEKIKALQKQ